MKHLESTILVYETLKNLKGNLTEDVYCNKINDLIFELYPLRRSLKELEESLTEGLNKEDVKKYLDPSFDLKAKNMLDDLYKEGKRITRLIDDMHKETKDFMESKKALKKSA